VEKAGFTRGTGSGQFHLDDAGLLQLLRRDIARVGGPSAWSRKAGVDRIYLYRVLHGTRRANATVAAALGLKTAYCRRADAGVSPSPHPPAKDNTNVADHD